MVTFRLPPKQIKRRIDACGHLPRISGFDWKAWRADRFLFIFVISRCSDKCTFQYPQSATPRPNATVLDQPYMWMAKRHCRGGGTY
jgi:hypothetical protein